LLEDHVSLEMPNMADLYKQPARCCLLVLHVLRWERHGVWQILRNTRHKCTLKEREKGAKMEIKNERGMKTEHDVNCTIALGECTK